MTTNYYIQTLEQEVEVHIRAADVHERAGQTATAAYFREGAEIAQKHLDEAREGLRTIEQIDKTPEWIRGEVEKMFWKGR